MARNHSKSLCCPFNGPVAGGTLGKPEEDSSTKSWVLPSLPVMLETHLEGWDVLYSIIICHVTVTYDLFYDIFSVQLYLWLYCSFWNVVTIYILLYLMCYVGVFKGWIANCSNIYNVMYLTITCSLTWGCLKKQYTNDVVIYNLLYTICYVQCVYY